MKKVRKWLCVVLSVFFVFFGIPVTPGQLVFTMPELTANAVNVGDKITVDNVTYEIMQNSSGIKYAAVKSFNGDGWTTKINIQSEVSGLPVRTIEKLGKSELISITGLLSGTSVQELFIPDSVQIIRRYSFVFSATLVNAYLGQVRSIGDHAFAECILLQDVDIPNRECEIADTAFYGCNNVIIHGYSGSTAETFAKEHGLKFVAYFDPLETTQPSISTTQTT